MSDIEFKYRELAGAVMMGMAFGAVDVDELATILKKHYDTGIEAAAKLAEGTGSMWNMPDLAKDIREMSVDGLENKEEKK